MLLLPPQQQTPHQLTTSSCFRVTRVARYARYCMSNHQAILYNSTTTPYYYYISSMKKTFHWTQHITVNIVVHRTLVCARFAPYNMDILLQSSNNTPHWMVHTTHTVSKRTLHINNKCWTNRQARDKFQWIAVWQLLYHLQHPACYQSRLQLISGTSIAIT